MQSETLSSLKERWQKGTFGEIFTDWKWIFSYSKRFKGPIAAYTVLGLLSSTLALVASIAGKFLVDVVVGHKVDQLWLAALVMAGSALLSLFITNLTGRIRQKLDVDMTNVIRADVFNSVMDAGWQSLNQFSNGDILNRFHGDIGTVANNAISWLPSVIISVYTFITTFAVIWHYSPVMSLIALSSAPVILLMSRYLVQKQKEHREEMMETTSKMYSFETEALYNLDTVKSFGIMDSFSSQLKELQNQYRRITLAWNMFQIRTNVFMAILSLIVEYIAYGYALFLLWGGSITYGTMTLFLQQRSSLSGAFHSVVGIIPGFITSSVSAHRIQELMALPREKHEEGGIPDEYYKGGLTLKMDKVDFAYDNGEQVIEESDFEAKPGQITALVGPSGEGKTTVLRLLLGILEPKDGSCAFIPENGEPLGMSAESRSLISYVPQGNTLLSGTIAENMRLAKKDATDEEIIAALKLACAWEFVEKLEKGINNDIYERGRGLSEGQAQRISIARALLRDAPVMLMDEATSALDVETERSVLRNILQKSPGRTFIITTHRPTVLSMCDRVYRVVEKKITKLGDEEVENIVRNF
ncbi:ABC transporter ATP-binding protein [Aristaeella lactis]|uniref:ABC-type multidrug transport system, ATPase and permease component n=1 Tax=Aristaeella lactis TaxID=3046383 RepID=A0AC61PJ68_9FIRM|nr:ABC transporter ATP-binding protein [Aristaeella lactis]QUA54017.1 ABC transporter ATP-binding protein [Aristaeella lactis]SMC42356.1 ABC-type multidrug transport system, ATPase and permease component [Aristaeella lactis]